MPALSVSPDVVRRLHGPLVCQPPGPGAPRHMAGQPLLLPNLQVGSRRVNHMQTQVPVTSPPSSIFFAQFCIVFFLGTPSCPCTLCLRGINGSLIPRRWPVQQECQGRKHCTTIVIVRMCTNPLSKGPFPRTVQYSAHSVLIWQRFSRVSNVVRRKTWW